MASVSNSTPSRPVSTDRRREKVSYWRIKTGALGRWDSLVWEDSSSRRKKTHSKLSLLNFWLHPTMEKAWGVSPEDEPGV